MKKIYFIFVICSSLLSHYITAQGISYEESVSDASTITFKNNLIKTSIANRLGNGASSIIIDFDQSDGNIWDEDAKGAILYACQLLEEYLCTTYPIRIKAVRNTNKSIGSALASTVTRIFENPDAKYANVPLYISPDQVQYKIPTASLKRMAVDNATGFFSEPSLFNEPDGTITFNPHDIYSCRIDGEVESGKYDLVTVTLREMAKILGMVTAARPLSGNQLSVIDEYGYVTPFAFRIFQDNYKMYDKSESYAYATSGNAYVGHDGWTNSIKLYSPSPFNLQKSLLYFAEDTNNYETLLLQPNLPKETSITRIGNGLLTALQLTGWITINEITGGGSTYTGKQYEGGVITPDNSELSFNENNLSSAKAQSLTQKEMDTFNNLRNKEKTILTKSHLTKVSFQNTLSNSDYNYFERDGILWDADIQGSDKLGWYFYLIKKDGTLDLVAQAPHLYTSFSVDLSQIENLDQYARTSDGYLRARLNCNRYSQSPTIDYNGTGYYYAYNYVRHLYIKYGIPIPQLEVRKNLLRSYARPDDPDYYYTDLTFSGVPYKAGQSCSIIQKEYVGRRVYTNIYDVDMNSLNYKALIDKNITTTFQLIVQDGDESSYSNIITVDPITTTSSSSHTMDVIKIGNSVELKFTTKEGNVADIELEEVKIVNVTNTASILSTSNKIIDITNLQTGVYGVITKDSRGNVYNAKFIK